MLILTAIRTQIKWILALFIVIFTLSVGFMYGTGRLRSGDEQHTGDYVVAVANGEELHISQLQQRVRDYVQRHGIRDLSDKQMPLIYKAAFDEMVSNRAVIDEVGRLKITAPVEDVENQLKALEKQYVTKEAFLQTIQSQGQTLDQVKAGIGRELAINKMLSDVSGGVVVSDDEIKALYDALKGNFTQPEGIQVNYASLKSRQAAERLIADAKEQGDWDKAVALVSADIVQATSGDRHERLANAEMVGKLEAVKDLKDGDVSAPIELTSQDFFVVQRLKALSEDVRPLSEVQDSLKNMLLQSKKMEVQQKYVKELAEKMNVKILTPDIFTVKSRDVTVPVSADTPVSADVSATVEKSADQQPAADAPAAVEKPADRQPSADAPTAVEKPADQQPAAEVETPVSTDTPASADASATVEKSADQQPAAEVETSVSADTSSAPTSGDGQALSADAAH